MVRRNLKIIEEKVVEGDIKFEGTLIFTQENVRVRGDIDALDIDAWNIDAGNINARNIDAWDTINVEREIRAYSVKGKIKHGKFVKKAGDGE